MERVEFRQLFGQETDAFRVHLDEARDIAAAVVGANPAAFDDLHAERPLQPFGKVEDAAGRREVGPRIDSVGLLESAVDPVEVGEG